MKILVVEDDQQVARQIETSLKNAGYVVEVVHDGEEGLYLGSHESFDAVILDLTVPGGMGGKEAIKKLMGMDSRVKAIVSSGYSQDPIMSNPEKYGFAGVVTKPYRIQEISEALCKILS